MAEKMFAHQIAARGLSEVVRVTSAGTGNWHAGSAADERAVRVLREHGYPDDHRAAAIGDDHLRADLLRGDVLSHRRTPIHMLQLEAHAGSKVAAPGSPQTATA